MRFNDTNNEDKSIVHDIDWWCGTNSTSFPIEDKTRRVNQWYYKVQTEIMQTDARFQFDDDNYSDLPEFRANLVDGQALYELPDKFMEVHAVEIKAQDGDYFRLDQIDLQDMEYTASDYRSTDGKPAEYDLTGDSLRLFPAPSSDSVELTNGLKVYITRNVGVFETSDTTKEPGFNDAFHEILSIGPAMDYLAVDGTNEDRSELQNRLTLRLQDLREFYSNRNVEANPAIRPQQENSTKYM